MIVNRFCYILVYFAIFLYILLYFCYILPYFLPYFLPQFRHLLCGPEPAIEAKPNEVRVTWTVPGLEDNEEVRVYTCSFLIFTLVKSYNVIYARVVMIRSVTIRVIYFRHIILLPKYNDSRLKCIEYSYHIVNISDRNRGIRGRVDKWFLYRQSLGSHRNRF